MSSTSGPTSCVLDEIGLYQPLSLVEICTKTLAQNIRLCEGVDLSGIDDGFLSSAILHAGSRVTADLLKSFEASNPYLVNEETDKVWRRLARSKYGGRVSLEDVKEDTWRDFYHAREAEQEHKMKTITLQSLRRKRKLEKSKRNQTKSLVIVEGSRPPSKLAKHVSSVGSSSSAGPLGKSKRGVTYQVADVNGISKLVARDGVRSRRRISGQNGPGLTVSQVNNSRTKSKSKMAKLLQASARTSMMLKGKNKF